MAARASRRSSRWRARSSATAREWSSSARSRSTSLRSRSTSLGLTSAGGVVPLGGSGGVGVLVSGGVVRGVMPAEINPTTGITQSPSSPRWAPGMAPSRSRRCIVERDTPVARTAPAMPIAGPPMGSTVGPSEVTLPPARCRRARRRAHTPGIGRTPHGPGHSGGSCGGQSGGRGPVRLGGWPRGRVPG